VPAVEAAELMVGEAEERGCLALVVTGGPEGAAERFDFERGDRGGK
jgi:hypothetical protein